MTRARAAAGSLLFLVVAPGVVAGLIPYLLTDRWESRDPAVAWKLLGGALIVAGAAVLMHAFARFVIEGIGTPAPVAPTRHLVVGGLYRYVRNPMYLAVGATIVGQAVQLGRPALLLYAALFMAVVATFVYGYEQPVLTERFGAEYERYRRNVPAWWPRLRPWTGAATGRSSSDLVQRPLQPQDPPQDRQ